MTPRHPCEESLMTMAEVAARLGVPLKTFRRWREHRQAPLGFRLGGRINYRWSEVEDWLQQQREEPASTLAAAPTDGHVRRGGHTSRSA